MEYRIPTVTHHLRTTMRILRPVLTSLLTLAVGMPALPAYATPSSHTSQTSSSGRERIHRHLQDLTRGGAVGAQVQVTDQNGTWTARAGTARAGASAPVPEGAASAPGAPPRCSLPSSCCNWPQKARLSLDAPLDRYLPSELVPGAVHITVRMLLQHTSGLHDLARDLPQGKDLVRTRFRHYDWAALVREAVARPAEFPPGTNYGYSNTNYLIAGLIIDRVTGHSYADEVRSRIIEPLHLRHTIVPGDKTSIPGPHAHGYLTLHGTSTHRGHAQQVDITQLTPSMAGPAGESSRPRATWTPSSPHSPRENSCTRPSGRK
ncbi:hypothetical protein CTZ40_00200 [Streptomyces rimosus]|nr:hypothetical protein CTZ40_00200 [Streptomyces rimosus]